MPFELRFSPAVRTQIEDYVERFDDISDQLDALAQIRRALEALAEDPRLGVTPRGAFAFPVYGFGIRIGDVGYRLRAAFCYSQDEGAIIITGVEQQLL